MSGNSRYRSLRCAKCEQDRRKCEYEGQAWKDGTPFGGQICDRCKVMGAQGCGNQAPSLASQRAERLGTTPPFTTPPTRAFALFVSSTTTSEQSHSPVHPLTSFFSPSHSSFQSRSSPPPSIPLAASPFDLATPQTQQIGTYPEAAVTQAWDHSNTAQQPEKNDTYYSIPPSAVYPRQEDTTGEIGQSHAVGYQEDALNNNSNIPGWLSQLELAENADVDMTNHAPGNPLLLSAGDAGVSEHYATGQVGFGKTCPEVPGSTQGTAQPTSIKAPAIADEINSLLEELSRNNETSQKLALERADLLRRLRSLNQALNETKSQDKYERTRHIQEAFYANR